MERRLFIRGAAACCAAPAGLVHAEPGVSDKEIVLGQTGILSGPLGAVVKEFNAGAQLAFGEANAGGGVGGRQVRLVSLDDELKPDLAVANYRRLMTEHQAFAFFGCVGSGTTAAAAELLRTSGVPSIGCYAVADSARQKVRGLAYSVRASNAREAQKLLQQIKVVGMKRVAAVGLDNAGGKEVIQLIQQAAVAEGLNFVGSATVKTDASNSHEAGLALAKMEPQAVLMYLSGALPVGVITAVRDAGSATVFFGMSIVQGQVLAKQLGSGTRGVAIAQVMPYPWYVGQPEIRTFTGLAERAGVEVTYTSYEGYVNARVMLETLARAGRALTRDRLLAALRSLRMRLAGIDVDFTDPQAIAGSRFVELVMVTPAGRYVR
jgi:branched-chain amino acid transport system substrate-binding protein